ncbi:YbhN family protein [Corynebacterium auriscanis]|uniref:lysylphosphatidylglycerol synthase transmembrane domain-containing protein n=1 Tax=Corynebacterium auriscanis TaxID=99807 RepID=UPI003CEF4984
MSQSKGKAILAFLRRPWVRAVLSLLLLVAILVAARDQLHFIGDGWREMIRADDRWLWEAAAMMGLAMLAQAEVMVVLMRSAGVKVSRLRVNALGLAANSVSSTFPGGPAISAAMIFREQMKWGATTVISSWYLVLSGVLAGGGMALLAIGAVFFIGRKFDLSTALFSLAALVILALATNWVASHPHEMERWLRARLRAYNRWRHKPVDRFEEKLVGLAEQLSTVQLPLPRLAISITASMAKWVFEILCLLGCIYAVGAEPPIAGVVLSFLAAKLVGQAQVTPGGLGPVDVALTTSLVGVASMTSVQAFASVICFRMISFVGLTIVGWIVFFTAQFSKVAKDGMTGESAAPMQGTTDADAGTTARAASVSDTSAGGTDAIATASAETSAADSTTKTNGAIPTVDGTIRDGR